jgi:hypothetical protein
MAAGVMGCGERPPDPISTPDASEAAIIEDLYNQANNPDAAGQILSVLQTRTPESQKTIIGLYSDGFLQRRGFGLGPERMELLKGLLAMYMAGIDVNMILDISRELPESGSAQFAFLPERTIVVLANEIASMWDPNTQNDFINELSTLFEETEFEINTANALVRSMEIRDFLNRLELAKKPSQQAQPVSENSNTYSNSNMAVSIEYPEGWIIEDFQDGFGLYSPTRTTALILKKHDSDDKPIDLISDFQESAKGGNPSLADSESQLAQLVEGVDTVEGLQVDKQFSYPSGNELTYLTDIIAIEKGGMNWLLLISSDYEDVNIDEGLERIVKSLKLN